MEEHRYQQRHGRKLFKWQFQLSGDDERDKRRMKIAFDKTLENFFSGPPPTRINRDTEPERY